VDVVILVSDSAQSSTDKLAVACYEHTKSVYAKEYSEVMELYYGMYVSTIRAALAPLGAPVYSAKPEMFFVLELPVPEDALDIHDCMREFCRAELLEGENAWLNEATGWRESVLKEIAFWSFPPVLAVCFKRFSPCGTHKNTAHIDFPPRGLDLARYVRGYNPKSYVYDLFGVCNHVGGVQHGHYTAHVLRSDGEWLHFNDEAVVPIAEDAHVVSSAAYCLFYRKRS
jgi:ubiquitin C-terminal hydrolase